MTAKHLVQVFQWSGVYCIDILAKKLFFAVFI